MSELAETISGFVAGDTLTVTRDVTNLDAAIETAWFTLKRHQHQADDDAVIQKTIDTDDETGVGQVTDAGGAGEDGALRFDFTPADTNTLGSQQWVYDIQIQLVGGAIYTIEKGTVTLTMDVTKATT